MSSRDILLAASGAQTGGPTDPNFKNVSLLLSGDGTNGAQNNTFLDSSTNNFTITRNGNTTQGSFSPYGNLWSNYFDGNGDYLTVPNNAAFNFGTGDFTIEAWVFIAGDSSLTDGGIRPANIVTAIPSSGTVDGWAFYILGNSTTTGTAVVFENTVSSVPYKVTYTATIPKNTWLNIAVARSGTVTKLFLNGTEVASATLGNQNISNYSNATVIGASTYAGYGSQLNGYLSNVRIVKGTAVYTSNFTPSTTPLTAVSGTSLLTCQSNRFIDNSSNNFTLTVNGNTSVQRFSPFNPTAPYSAATIGGSGYFDGTGDNLSVPDNTAWDFGTAAFTVEAWVYTPSVSGTQMIVSQYNTSNGFSLQLSTNTLKFYFGSTVLATTSAGTISTNTWQHCVAVRSGTTLSLFINGVRSYSVINSTNITGSNQPVVIGDISSVYGQPFTGYISNVRIITGTAAYDPSASTITVPTAPLTAITNTSLLCNFTNAGIPDAAMMNDLETVGNAQVSTSVKKYGTGSLYFDGTGDRLAIPSNPVIPFGTGNFTIEFWVYFNAVNNGTIKFFFDFRNAGATTAALIAQETDNSWTCNNGSGATLDTGWNSSTFTTGTWYHIAMCRSSSVTKFFVNGTQTSSVSDTGNYSNSTLSIAARYSNEYSLNGYIDDFRITKGYARYTANFTPPTAALPVY